MPSQAHPLGESHMECSGEPTAGFEILKRSIRVPLQGMSISVSGFCSASLGLYRCCPLLKYGWQQAERVFQTRHVPYLADEYIFLSIGIRIGQHDVLKGAQHSHRSRKQPAEA